MYVLFFVAITEIIIHYNSCLMNDWPLSIYNRVISFFIFLEGDDEVTFDPDDIIEDIEEVDDGWWMGTVNGKRGLFPANYVELI